MSLRRSIIPFSISGTGTAVGSQVMLPSGKFNGSIRRIIARQDVGGGATACAMYCVHREHAGTDPAAIPDEYVVVETTSMTPTASATAAFLDTPLDSEPTFRDGLKLFVKVTAGAGAWTFVGFVEVEM